MSSILFFTLIVSFFFLPLLLVPFAFWVNWAGGGAEWRSLGADFILSGVDLAVMNKQFLQSMIDSHKNNIFNAVEGGKCFSIKVSDVPSSDHVNYHFHGGWVLVNYFGKIITIPIERKKHK